MTVHFKASVIPPLSGLNERAKELLAAGATNRVAAPGQAL
jgi:hypothetical protein